MWQLLALAPGLHRGLRRRNARRFRTTGFHARTDKRRSINADGELRTHTPAYFRIIPRAVEVFAPRGMIVWRARAENVRAAEPA